MKPEGAVRNGIARVQRGGDATRGADGGARPSLAGSWLRNREGRPCSYLSMGPGLAARKLVDLLPRNLTACMLQGGLAPATLGARMQEFCARG